MNLLDLGRDDRLLALDAGDGLGRLIELRVQIDFDRVGFVDGLAQLLLGTFQMCGAVRQVRQR